MQEGVRTDGIPCCVHGGMPGFGRVSWPSTSYAVPILIRFPPVNRLSLGYFPSFSVRHKLQVTTDHVGHFDAFSMPTSDWHCTSSMLCFSAWNMYIILILRGPKKFGVLVFLSRLLFIEEAQFFSSSGHIEFIINYEWFELTDHLMTLILFLLSLSLSLFLLPGSVSYYFSPNT